jgi:microcystin degradation protein MlrC
MPPPRELIEPGCRAPTSRPAFPASDIHDCGAAVFTYGSDAESTQGATESTLPDGDGGGAGLRGAAVLAGRGRARSDAPLAIRFAPAAARRHQDNPGAGGSADTSDCSKRCSANRAERAVLGVLHDPEAARAAHGVGPGKVVTVGVGAKSGGWGEKPVVESWTVERVGDGRMTCHGPMMTNWKLALGPMALLRSGGVSVVVSTKKVQAMDQEPFRHLGVEPRAERIVALKSSVHFRAHFEPIAEDVLVVESPGAMIVDPVKLPFTRLRPGVRMRPLGRLFRFRTSSFYQAVQSSIGGIVVT